MLWRLLLLLTTVFSSELLLAAVITYAADPVLNVPEVRNSCWSICYGDSYRFVLLIVVRSEFSLGAVTYTANHVRNVPDAQELPHPTLPHQLSHKSSHILHYLTSCPTRAPTSYTTLTSCPARATTSYTTLTSCPARATTSYTTSPAVPQELPEELYVCAKSYCICELKNCCVCDHFEKQ